MKDPTLAKAAQLGKGFCSDVYDWGEGRVLKLFHGLGPQGRAEREFEATKAIHGAGFPVPKAFELVEVEGRRGIVFERIDGVSLLGFTHKRPWTIPWAVRLLAELHAKIHRHLAPTGLPSLRKRIAARIDASDAPEAAKQTARERLAALPDGTALCHGDFHPDNILITSRGPVVIDWSSASCGDPLGDVACTSHLMRNASLPPWAPAYMHLLLRCLRSRMHSAYLKRYLRLRPGTRRQIEAWDAPLAVAAKSWRIPETI